MIMLTVLKFLVYFSTLSSHGLIILTLLYLVFLDACMLYFLNPGCTLDSRLYALCKRAFRIVHGVGIRSCSMCYVFDFLSRRVHLSQNLFMTSLRNPAHVLHPLVPHTSHRSSRLILPHISSSRRKNGFIFSCSVQ